MQNSRQDIPKSVSEEFASDIYKEMRRKKLRDLMPVIILTALILFFSISTKGFFSLSNLKSLLNQLALPLLVSVSVTFVIMLGSINLAVEGLMALAGCVFSVLVLNSRTSNNFGLWAVPVVLVVGLIAGLLIGVIHVKVKLPSFMVTYAFNFIFLGFALMSYMGIPATITDPILSTIHLKEFLGIPLITWIALLIFIIALVLQKKTAFGQYIFAIGSNEKNLQATGVNVSLVKMGVFAFSGVCLSIAGIIAALRLGRGEVAMSSGKMFPAFTAIVLGGTPMSGGRGGMLNTLIGTLVITVLVNGMVLMGVSAYVQDGIQGIVILLAVILSIKRGHRIVNK